MIAAGPPKAIAPPGDGAPPNPGCMSILLTGRFDAGERDEWLTLLRAALPDETLVLEADADVDIAIVANRRAAALQACRSSR